MECVCVCVRTTHPLCVQSKYTNCHQQIYLVFSNESQRAALYVIISKQQITNDLIWTFCFHDILCLLIHGISDQHEQCFPRFPENKFKNILIAQNVSYWEWDDKIDSLC